ncbi:MAG: hypothetical protein J6J42_02700 [Lachnospiraceae bacterium]|nr:hypothetical protein [Lachnospiraceae bacterium]
MQVEKEKKFYEVLDEFQKSIYDRIYDGILQRKSVIIFGNPKLQTERNFMDKILFLLLADYPEIFNVDFENTTYVFSRNAIIMGISYVFSEKEQKSFEWRVARKVATLTENIKTYCGNDKKQQIRYLYDYFVANISYATDELKSENRRILCRIHSVLGSLLDGKAVCDGIARGFKLFLDELGIDNWVIRQELKKGMAFSHEWNVVMLGGEVWHFDITWEIDLYNLSKQTLFRYYMLSEKEMRMRHEERIC